MSVVQVYIGVGKYISVLVVGKFFLLHLCVQPSNPLPFGKLPSDLQVAQLDPE